MNLFTNSYWEEITDPGLESLGQSLQRMPRLESVSLDFSGCLKVTDKGLKSLNESIRRIVSLKSISLNFLR